MFFLPLSAESELPLTRGFCRFRFDPGFLIVPVHVFDQILEHRVDVTALHLAGRRRVALLRIEFLGNDPEFLDLLDASELAR